MKNCKDKFNFLKICILGLGIENEALIKFLLKEKIRLKYYNITICDVKNRQRLGERYEKLKKYKSIKWKLGKDYDKNLDQYDIIFRIAGYPLFSEEIKKAKKVGVKISSATKLFFDLCPSRNIVGITGTAGKGTTASLIYTIFKTAKKRVFLGGNIGVPMFSFIEKIEKQDWIVLELSSFQLEDLHKSPKIAVITNFFKDHLTPANPNNPNYHKSMKDYWNAKSNIFKYGAKIIANYELRKTNYKLPTETYFFSASNQNATAYFQNNSLIVQNLKFSICDNKNSADIQSKQIYNSLLGTHNQENIAAAALTVKLAGITNNDIIQGINKFKGLPHRLEFIKEINNIKYYNDSFSKTPENTIMALRALKKFSIILIAGGADKGADFQQLAKEVKKFVKFVILLKGNATTKIKQQLLKINYLNNKMKLVDNMKDAVKTAKSNAIEGDIILLSPACASFGMFKDYKERGEKFKKYLNI